MPGGPIAPISVWPDTNGRIFPGRHQGATNSRRIQGMQVQASLGANSVLDLLFPPVPALPSGTLNLYQNAIADAASGDARVNPAWAALTAGTNYDTASLFAEGVQTITWVSGDNHKIKETKIVLDADTPAANRYIFMRVTFETTSWTLAAISTWNFFLIWE